MPTHEIYLPWFSEQTTWLSTRRSADSGRLRIRLLNKTAATSGWVRHGGAECGEDVAGGGPPLQLNGRFGDACLNMVRSTAS